MNVFSICPELCIPERLRYQCQSKYSFRKAAPLPGPHFLEAPKLVLFLFPAASASLSSVSFFFFLLLPPVGVAVPLFSPLKEPDTGVGTCEAGVEAGVPSYKPTISIPLL